MQAGVGDIATTLPYTARRAGKALRDSRNRGFYLLTTLTPADTTALGLCCHYTHGPDASLGESEKALAIIGFAGCAASDRFSTGYIASGLRALTAPGTPQPLEVWEAAAPLQRGWAGDIQWSSNEELLWAVQRIDERRYPSQAAAIHAAYNGLIGFVGARGYPHLARVWNYMADINSGRGDQERYRQFCLGRLRAFTDSHYRLEQFPAACALGHHGGETLIYLLATKQPVRHFENPLQISAYHYPDRYGPASPSFARATLARWRCGQQLFISGTASIVGHESLYDDELHKQVAASCQNVRAVMQHAGERIGRPGALRLAAARVYLRHAHHLEPARAGFEGQFGTGLPVLYLQADICRRELLVEIEGVCHPV